jgi:oligopeptide/dipeptide ABC transporter ATP-binding protein
MVFQDPFASLNPRKRVGQIIGMGLRLHGSDRKDVEAQVKDLLDRVGLHPEHINRFPHEFSGGQRQRIGVARALALEPRLIVLDEPVSALDVSVQAQIINLLDDLQDQFKLTYLFVAHDLSVVRHVSDRIAVMYAGRIIEEGTLDQIFYDPQHPYTWGLLGSITRVDRPRPERLPAIKGLPPSLANRPEGCHFRPRCPHEFAKCIEIPPLEARVDGQPNHLDRCWLSVEDKRKRREVRPGEIGLPDKEEDEEAPAA